MTDVTHEWLGRSLGDFDLGKLLREFRDDIFPILSEFVSSVYIRANSHSIQSIISEVFLEVHHASVASRNLGIIRINGTETRS